METPKMVAFVVKRYGTHYARPKNGGTQYAVRKDKKRRYAVRKGGRGVTLMYLFSKWLTFCPFFHKVIALRLVVGIAHSDSLSTLLNSCTSLYKILTE